MSSPVCVSCGALLLHADGGECPNCLPRALTDGVNESDLATLEPIDPQVDLQPWAEPHFGPIEEVIYQDAREQILYPKPGGMRSYLVLGATLALFVASMRGGNTSRELLMLVGVLFFHELGHWAGMRFFGYSDVKMFFIPFLGAAVSGKHQGAPQWQQAIVLLLGPLPGLVLGCTMLFWNLAIPYPLVRELGFMLVALNAFNLLPLVPLDGGRLLNLIIFSRHPALESVFLAMTALAVIGIGFLLPGAYFFAVLGLGGLVMAPLQFRVARAAETVRKTWPGLPPRIANATDLQLRDLFLQARKFSQGKAQIAAKHCATMMISIHERAVVKPIGLLATLGLLAAYGAGYFLSLASFVAFALQVNHKLRP